MEDKDLIKILDDIEDSVSKTHTTSFDQKDDVNEFLQKILK